MDKLIQNNIDIHLSEKVLTDFVEILKNLNVKPAGMPVMQQVVTEQMDTGSQGSIMQEGADAKEAHEKVHLIFGDTTEDKMVKEGDQGKSYEKFISEGHRQKAKGMESDLLGILKEIESEPQIQGKVSFVLNPAPIDHKEFSDRNVYHRDEDDEGSDEDTPQHGDEDGEDGGEHAEGD